MVKTKDIKEFITTAFLIGAAFAFGGAGLSILFNSKGDTVSVIGGFILIGLAIAIIYEKIKNE
ncbi:MAG: hypothetical protein KKG60_03565 [Nanoarchaeota archaeon]|nr:hypothetical protein [Nanoarchaeota archaeon]